MRVYSNRVYRAMFSVSYSKTVYRAQSEFIVRYCTEHGVS